MSPGLTLRWVRLREAKGSSLVPGWRSSPSGGDVVFRSAGGGAEQDQGEDEAGHAGKGHDENDREGRKFCENRYSNRVGRAELRRGDREFVDVRQILAGGFEADGIGGAGVEGGVEDVLVPGAPVAGGVEGDGLLEAVDEEAAGAGGGGAEGVAEGELREASDSAIDVDEFDVGAVEVRIDVAGAVVAGVAAFDGPGLGTGVGVLGGGRC